MLSIVCLYNLKSFTWKWRFSTMKKAQHQTSFFQFLIFLDQCLQVLASNLSKGSFFVYKNFHIKSIYWYCWYEHYHYKTLQNGESKRWIYMSKETEYLKFLNSERKCTWKVINKLNIVTATGFEPKFI